jgi:DNA mismatch endonuclease Vsr
MTTPWVGLAWQRRWESSEFAWGCCINSMMLSASRRRAHLVSRTRAKLHTDDLSEEIHSQRRPAYANPIREDARARRSQTRSDRPRRINDAAAKLMADNLSKSERSIRMSLIRSKDTKPELVVRKALWAAGFRYRLHRSGLPGKPDLVFKGLRTVVFINGCYWHAHSCQRGRIPAQNSRFWRAKFVANKARDRRNCKRLRSHGWSVLTVWECSLSTEKSRDASIRKLLLALSRRAAGTARRKLRICHRKFASNRSRATVNLEAELQPRFGEASGRAQAGPEAPNVGPKSFRANPWSIRSLQRVPLLSIYLLVVAGCPSGCRRPAGKASSLSSDRAMPSGLSKQIFFFRRLAYKFEWPKQGLEKTAHSIDDVLRDHRPQLCQFKGKVDLIAGGPPCQGFSFAGKRNAADPRNRMFERYVSFVGLIRPKFLVLENVPGMNVAHSKRTARSQPATRLTTKNWRLSC